MKVLAVYARLYAECLRQTVAGLRKNAWTLLLPAVLYLAWGWSAIFAAPLGLVGGLVRALFVDALGSCYLYFLGEVVSHSRVSVNEMGRSIGAYFWSIVNLWFVLWIAEWVASAVLRGNPNQALIVLGLSFVAFVLLSAAPEAIYQRGTYGGLATIQKSIAFLQQHWIEWLLPSVVFLLAIWWVPDLSLYGALGLVTTGLVKGAIFHVGMVFRGHLFTALDGSTHRQRMFKYRGSGPVGG